MITDNNANINPENNRTEDPNQSQNNNGNIGREVDEERGDSGQYSIEKPVNETGRAENQETHWSGDEFPESDVDPASRITSEADPASTPHSAPDNGGLNARIRTEGRNHVFNVGGTSQEDLERGDTGLSEEY